MKSQCSRLTSRPHQLPLSHRQCLYPTCPDHTPKHDTRFSTRTESKAAPAHSGDEYGTLKEQSSKESRERGEEGRTRHRSIISLQATHMAGRTSSSKSMTSWMKSDPFVLYSHAALIASLNTWPHHVERDITTSIAHTLQRWGCACTFCEHDADRWSPKRDRRNCNKHA